MEVNGLYRRLWSGCWVKHCFVETPYAGKKKNPVYPLIHRCKLLPCADRKQSEGCPELATVTSIFSQYGPARNPFPFFPLPPSPSPLRMIRLGGVWASRPLLGSDSTCHENPLSTHALNSVTNVMEFTPVFTPSAHIQKPIPSRSSHW